MNNEQVMVSIRCITYNHVNYIRQCLEGFVMQKTNFKFKAIVHDDASTDGTADIIREYAQKYPDIIYPILQTENQYSKGYSRIRTLLDKHCTGKYVAICEGDDYWTDPQKLQKQVDFLEAHSDYSACFHQAIRHYEDGSCPDMLYSVIEDRDYSGLELYEGHRPPTASILVRTNVYKSNVYIKSIEANLSFGDIPLFLACAHEGKVRGMSDVMSGYRMQASGMSNIFKSGDNQMLKFAEDNLMLYKIFGKEYRDICIRVYIMDYLNYFFINYHKGKIKITSLLKILTKFPFKTLRIIKERRAAIHRKKLMLLGGIRYLLPVIKAAHEQGYFVITADNVPDNIAHKYSDEYIYVNIVDKEAVLQVAKEKNINGIMSFGVDPGVVSAAYVQEKMNLPSFGPFKSVEILQNKDKFRAFLHEHDFNAPWAKGFSTVDEAMSESDSFPWPVIVKPTDSAGSKGVTRVDNPEMLRPALKHAMAHSISGHIIIEEFIEKKGCSSDSDCMSVNGQLVFTSFSAQRFDAHAPNPYTPAAFSWPSTFTEEEELYLTKEVQRLFSLLQMNTAVYNIETRIGTNGKPYIMEVSPRGGGNRLCEMLRYATGIDLITAITRAMVGDTFEDITQKPYQGHWAEIILHADKEGTFSHLEIKRSPSFEIIEEDVWVKKGDAVSPFHGANNAIGTLVVKFMTAEDMETAINNHRDWINIVVT